MDDRTGRTSVKDDAARAIGYLLDRRLGSDEAAVRAALQKGEACAPAVLAKPTPIAPTFVCRQCRAAQTARKQRGTTAAGAEAVRSDPARRNP